MRQRQRPQPTVPTVERQPSEEELHAQRLREQTNVSGLAGLQGMQVDDTEIQPAVVEHRPITYEPSQHMDEASAALETQLHKRKREAQDKLYKASVADYDARQKALEPRDTSAEEAARKRRKVEGEQIEKYLTAQSA